MSRDGFISGRIWLTIVTIPGVVIHELAHYFACKVCGVRVHETCFFRRGVPAGYVIHDYPSKFSKSFLISTAPFLFNSGISLLAYYGLVSIFLTVGIPPIQWPPSNALVGAVFLSWIGFSSALHAFPSSEDADHVWDATKRALPWNPFTLLVLPVIILIKILNWLRCIGIDIGYSCAVGIIGLIIAKRIPAENHLPWWNDILYDIAYGAVLIVS